jgi:tRNA pseudouridine38-40 synthase
MTRYKLTIEYDGTTLIGWQENRQGDSVQSILQAAIFQFCGERVVVVAAGRTDAGVHARGMACHFDIGADHYSPDTIAKAINFHLTNSPVAVLNCEQMTDDFHARFSAKKRNYEYVILNRAAPAVLDKNRVWWMPRKLDVGRMKQAAEKLVGSHDFTSFRASECQSKSPVKTIDEIRVTRYASRVTIRVGAKSFLHHQVRNIVGTLVEIGLGRDLDIDEILAAKNRRAAGPTAPASGLYFVSAEY